MASGFRGTGAGQDVRFSNKEKKLMKSMKFPEELNVKVNLKKVNMEVMKPWIAKRVTELLGGLEDEVLIGLIYNQLELSDADPKKMQINLTGFLEKNTSLFMKELWTLLASAQGTKGGVPQQFLDEEAERLRKLKEEQDRITAEVQKQREAALAEAEARRKARAEAGEPDRPRERGSRWDSKRDDVARGRRWDSTPEGRGRGDENLPPPPPLPKRSRSPERERPVTRRRSPDRSRSPEDRRQRNSARISPPSRHTSDRRRPGSDGSRFRRRSPSPVRRRRSRSPPRGMDRRPMPPPRRQFRDEGSPRRGAPDPARPPEKERDEVLPPPPPKRARTTSRSRSPRLSDNASPQRRSLSPLEPSKDVDDGLSKEEKKRLKKEKKRMRKEKKKEKKEKRHRQEREGTASGDDGEERSPARYQHSIEDELRRKALDAMSR